MSFCHVDDTHLFYNSTDPYCEKGNSLNLNASKCDIVTFKKSSIGTNEGSIEVGGYIVFVRDAWRNLLRIYQWKQDLSSSSAIQTESHPWRTKSIFSLAASMPLRANWAQYHVTDMHSTYPMELKTASIQISRRDCKKNSSPELCKWRGDTKPCEGMYGTGLEIQDKFYISDSECQGAWRWVGHYQESKKDH